MTCKAAAVISKDLLVQYFGHFLMLVSITPYKASSLVII